MVTSLSYEQLLFLWMQSQDRLIHCTILSFRELSKGKWIVEGEKGSFLLCLAPPLLRFHFLSQKPKSYSTPLSTQIEQAIRGSQIIKGGLLNKDRILFLSFSSSYTLIAELFSKGANLYLVDDKEQILCSYVPQKKTHYLPPPNLSHLPSQLPLPSPEKWEDFFQKEEEQFLLSTEKKLLIQEISHQVKRLCKALHSLEEQKKETDLWEQKQQEALFLQAHFHELKKGMSSLEGEDWISHKKISLSLDPLLEPKEQLAVYFSQVKRAKKRQIHVDQTLEKNRQIYEKLQKTEEMLNQASTLDEVRFLRQKLFPEKKPLSKEERTKRERVYSFHSLEGLEILVGKSAPDNDHLTFRIAKGNDSWFHAKDFAGSHVVIRLPKGKQPNHETILDAAQLALYYSKGREKKEGEVIMAQCKSLKRVKGASGQVLMGAHKSLLIRLDPQRLARLQNKLSAPEVY